MKKDNAISALKKLQNKESRPKLKWQKAEWSRNAQFKFCLPYQFLLICRLLDTTPNQVLTDFMDNLDSGSWKREGRDKVKEKLVDYFLEHGYGQQQYSALEIRQMFKEMDAIGMLFPKNGKPKDMELYTQWKDRYQVYWFKKWLKKTNDLFPGNMNK